MVVIRLHSYLQVTDLPQHAANIKCDATVNEDFSLCCPDVHKWSQKEIKKSSCLLALTYVVLFLLKHADLCIFHFNLNQCCSTNDSINMKMETYYSKWAPQSYEKSCTVHLFIHLVYNKICIPKRLLHKIIKNMPADLPSLDIPQHLGKLDGMQKKSVDINMATVPSVTYLMRKHIYNICILCINIM